MAEEDILFGKRRHLFGGIAPGNMKKFRVYNLGSIYTIDAVLPDDTVINGETVCSVSGAVIRMKKDGIPKDEFDGEYVATIYESMHFRTTYEDVNLDGACFAAFPFSTQGVYNRNEANYATPDHYTTFLDPSLEIIKSYSNGNQNITIRLENVNWDKAYVYRRDNYYDIEMSTYDYVKLNVNGNDIPATEELVVNVVNGVCEINDSINGVSDRVALYRALYSIIPAVKLQDGSELRIYDLRNRIQLELGNNNYIYGFDLDTKDPNPATRVTYPDDVDNTAFNPAKIIPGVTFDYGDWPSKPGVDFMPKPVMIDTDGTIIGYLHPDDYDKIDYVDGTSGDTEWDLSTTYNAMMQWPKIYVKRSYDETTGIYKFRCSDYRIDSSWECWSNYDYNDNEIDHFYTPIYGGSLVGSTLRSLSGRSISAEKSASNGVTRAMSNGNDWYIEEYVDRLLIQDLLIMMAKTTDCQKAYGNGVTNGTDITKTGTMNQKGMFWGSDDGDSGVKVFGMEHWWGNHNRNLAGLLWSGGKLYAKPKRGTYSNIITVVTYSDSSTEGYINLGNIDSNSGFINSMSWQYWGRYPSTNKGSATTYEADYVTIAPDSTDVCYARVGGNKSYRDGKAGPFTVDLTTKGAITSTATDTISALSYKPSAS